LAREKALAIPDKLPSQAGRSWSLMRGEPQ
jgi:hypothetical protein